MCLRQNCFRARVSAKPWRAGITEHLPHYVWPIDPAHDAQPRANWVTHYEEAACRFTEAWGNRHIDAHVRPVLDWHDTLCQANSDLPLA